MAGRPAALPSKSDDSAKIRAALSCIRTHRRNFYHILRVVINQLQPIFGDVGRRENIILRVFGLEGHLQILFGDSGESGISDSGFSRIATTCAGSR
jgi:hypothetical protein